MEFLPVADIMPICLDKPFSYCDKMHLAETNPAFTMVIIVQWDKRSHINLFCLPEGVYGVVLGHYLKFRMERMFSVINNRYKAFYGISNSFCWQATISHDILTSQSDALYQVCVQNMIDSGDSSFFLVKTRHLQRNWAANSLVGVFYESHSSPCPQEQMRSGLQRSGEFTFFSTPPDVFCIFQTCSLQHHPTLSPDFTQHPLEPQKALYNFFFFTCKQTLKCIIQLSTRLIPIPERLFFFKCMLQMPLY